PAMVVFPPGPCRLGRGRAEAPIGSACASPSEGTGLQVSLGPGRPCAPGRSVGCARPNGDGTQAVSPTGNSTSTTVPSLGGLTIVSVPPRASTRSDRPTSPEPLPGSANPTPSSR